MFSVQNEVKSRATGGGAPTKKIVQEAGFFRSTSCFSGLAELAAQERIFTVRPPERTERSSALQTVSESAAPAAFRRGSTFPVFTD